MSLHGKLVAVASRWLLKLFFLKLNDVLDVVRPRHWSWGTAVFWIPNKAVCILKQNENNLFHDQGCALRKISGSPSGSQAFYLSRPGLNVCRPNKNFGEPFGLPSIPAGVPRPLKLVARVHLMSKYLYARESYSPSPNSVILAFGFDQNPHDLLWNPSKFSCHSDLKPETGNATELFRF